MKIYKCAALFMLGAFLTAVPLSHVVFAGNLGKVTICHFPDGKEIGNIISVGAPAVEAHVRLHGDLTGHQYQIVKGTRNKCEPIPLVKVCYKGLVREVTQAKADDLIRRRAACLANPKSVVGTKCKCKIMEPPPKEVVRICYRSIVVDVEAKEADDLIKQGLACLADPKAAPGSKCACAILLVKVCSKGVVVEVTQKDADYLLTIPGNCLANPKAIVGEKCFCEIVQK